MMGFGFSPGGRAAKASAAVYDPAALSLSGWWRANYSGDPWVANASAGASGSNGSITVGSAAGTAGTTQNGYTPIDLNGTTQDMVNASASTTLFTTTAGTIIVLFYADSASMPGANLYEDPALFRNSNDDHGLVFTTDGVSGFAYQSAYKTKTVACGTAAYHLVMMRRDGSVIGITLDSAADSTAACTTLTVMVGTVVVGHGYGGSRFDGRILEIMTSTTALSNTDYGNVKDYCNSRYALAL